ncbi:hypothetical protein DPMN_038629 [Dreissena polymorpha]|uniref:Uncharacterized protein n=1 Tax=Dreissena polymorpha TaxID=45954 RepID=A0A9D4MHF9_DREPO|nr:hypothetical protein DPMN_038629 [Dreissena polymorpha]
MKMMMMMMTTTTTMLLLLMMMKKEKKNNKMIMMMMMMMMLLMLPMLIIFNITTAIEHSRRSGPLNIRTDVYTCTTNKHNRLHFKRVFWLKISSFSSH